MVQKNIQLKKEMEDLIMSNTTIANTNIANREVCDLIFVDYASKKPF